MQAVILAGGKGTRLQPYTNVLPKPLMPISNLPILEIVIKQLKYHGFNKIILCVGHLSHLIKSFFGDGKRWGVEIEYSVEDKAMGTAGPIANLDSLEDNFLVINGDILSDVDFGALMDSHLMNNQVATLAYCKRDITVTLGVVDVDHMKCLQGYREKPNLSYHASMGLYCMNKKIMKYVPKGKRIDLPEVMQKLMENEILVHTYHHEGIWLDIGRAEDYELATDMFEENPGTFLKL